MLPGLDGFETCRRLRADGVWVAGDHAHRARRGRGPRARARRGRRRLPDQAVLAGRAAGAAAGAGPPRPGRAPGRARGRRPAARPGRPARCVGATPRSSCRPASSRCSRRFMRRPGQVLSQSQLLESAWDSATSSARTSSRSTSATCARRSTGRSASRSIETVRGAGLPAAQGRRRHEPAADPRPADGGVRAGHGRGARRRRGCSSTCGCERTSTRASTDGLETARGGRGRRSGVGRSRPARTRRASHSCDRGRRGRDSAGGAGSRSVLTPAELARAATGEQVLVERDVPGIEGHARGSLAQPRRTGGRSWSSGQSLDDRDETLAGLLASFAIGGPIAVLLASLLGYALAAAGLRPGRGDAPPGGRGVARAGRRAPAAARRARRDPAARGDAERDARPAARARSSASGASSPTRATSCARRWRWSRPSSRRALRAGDADPHGARGAGRPRSRSATASPSSPRTCWCWPAAATAGCPCARATSTRAELLERRARALRGPGSRARPRDPRGGARRAAPSRPTRCACARRSATSWTTRCATATGDVVLAARARRRRGRARGGRRGPRLPARAGRARLRALRPRRRAPARAAAPGWGWRSSRAIAEAHGGSADIVPGPGATLRISLPASNARSQGHLSGPS